ncbi:unnamed protein product [Trichogramma brassicae]|uniref:Uncharacterized protein n=1 Tax=Trichogramma brassicae TaxID=86971 RepID=A0A6H5I5U6_9HYME|nr:unnamed protein product [Trichogramma brassicae]
MTPLHAICRDRIKPFNWHKGMAEKLFDVCDERQQPVRIDARDDSGRTALQLAAKSLRADDVDALLARGADLGPGFVFPKQSNLDEWLGSTSRKESHFVEIKLLLASSVLAICESLERRGAYELSRADDTRTVMRLFLRAGLCETPWLRGCVGRMRELESFAETAKEKQMKPGVSFCDVFWAKGGEKRARKLLSYRDYFEFARGDRLRHHRFLSELMTVHLCEQMGRRFFKRWALEPLQRLTHHTLPWFCYDMIMENGELSNADLWRIFVADERLSS